MAVRLDWQEANYSASRLSGCHCKEVEDFIYCTLRMGSVDRRYYVAQAYGRWSRPFCYVLLAIFFSASHRFFGLRLALPTALSGSPVLPSVYSICSIMNGYSSSEIFELMAHSHTIAHYEDRIHPLCISIMAGITTDTLGSSDARSSSCGKSPLDERVMPATSEMSPNSTFCDVKPDGRSLKIVAVSNVRQCLLRGSSPW
jgi:hypothetical protein